MEDDKLIMCLEIASWSATLLLATMFVPLALPAYNWLVCPLFVFIRTAEGGPHVMAGQMLLSCIRMPHQVATTILGSEAILDTNGAGVLQDSNAIDAEHEQAAAGAGALPPMAPLNQAAKRPAITDLEGTSQPAPPSKGTKQRLKREEFLRKIRAKAKRPATDNLKGTSQPAPPSKGTKQRLNHEGEFEVEREEAASWAAFDATIEAAREAALEEAAATVSEEGQVDSERETNGMVSMAQAGSPGESTYAAGMEQDGTVDSATAAAHDSSNAKASLLLQAAEQKARMPAEMADETAKVNALIRARASEAEAQEQEAKVERERTANSTELDLINERLQQDQNTPHGGSVGQK